MYEPVSEVQHSAGVIIKASWVLWRITVELLTSSMYTERLGNSVTTNNAVALDLGMLGLLICLNWSETKRKWCHRAF